MEDNDLKNWVQLVKGTGYFRDNKPPSITKADYEFVGTDWHADIHEMHTKFGVRNHVEKFDAEKLKHFLTFRLKFLREELEETEKAAYEGKEVDCEEVVDGLIDLCVVAIGTLHAFGIDAHKAWGEVHKANMSKEVGVKEGRENPLGLPDLCKPKGWQPPSHQGNHGILPKLNE